MFDQLPCPHAECVKGECLVEFALAGWIVPEALVNDRHDIAFGGDNFKSVSRWSRAESETLYGACGLREECLLRLCVVG